MNRKEPKAGSVDLELSQFAGSPKDSDRSGTPAKHSTFSFWIEQKDGTHAVIYSHQLGGAWMSPEKTRIEIIYSGWHRFTGTAEGRRYDGEWLDGIWLVVITGKRLGMVFDHLGEGIRRNTNRVNDTGEKPEVSDTMIQLVRLMEDED